MGARPPFYLGLILFAVGALLGCFVFLGTLVVARAGNPTDANARALTASQAFGSTSRRGPLCKRWSRSAWNATDSIGGPFAMQTARRGYAEPDCRCNDGGGVTPRNWQSPCASMSNARLNRAR